MEDMNKEIGQRLRAARELSERTAAAFAQAVGVSEADLLAYEAGAQDIPVSLLHNVSGVSGVSTTELMTGESARLRQYCVVRRGKGVAVQRRAAYGYQSLAYNFAGRAMEPMRITIPAVPEDAPWSLTTHGGQEFHYCLAGRFAIKIGSHTLTLEEGDSIYFDSSSPHGMKALGGDAQSLVVITM